MIVSEFFDQVFFGNTIKAYCLFAGIILLGLIFKTLVSKGISLLLFKLFKRFAQDTHDDAFVALLLKPIASFISLATLYLAVNQLKYPLDVIIFRGKHGNLLVTIGDIVDKTFLFFIILSIFWIVLRIIDFLAHVMLFRASLTDNKSDDQMIYFGKELLKAGIIILAGFVEMGSVFNLNVATIIASLGIGGIAVALAAKESLENLIASFTIFLDKPFTVGDNVNVKGVEGSVEKVGFRSTLIRTSAKTMATLPNKAMIDSVLENQSLRNFRKIKFKIGLVYTTTPESLKLIVAQINDYLSNTDHIAEDGIAYLEGFGDSALNIEVIYFVNILGYNDYLRLKEEINYKIIDIVKSNGSDFANPV